MTREQARRELEGTWIFKDVNGMIALRDVELIQAVEAYEAEQALGRREPVSSIPTPHAWPAL